MAVNGYSLASLADFMHIAEHEYAVAGNPPPTPIEQGWHLDKETEHHVPAWIHHPSPEMELAWESARETFGAGKTITALVTGWNRGGLLVRWEQLQGFVPISQLKDIPSFDDPASRDEKLARWVGEELLLRIIELDQSRNRLVFSERATLWGPKDGDRVLSEIQTGQTVVGIVSNICEFGVFIDLGGVDGLIHISELSWGRVNHPSEILSLGQSVQVYVLNTDRSKRRIGLSLKRLQPNPWAIVESKYKVGQIIPAVITNIVDFGAFAQIEEGLEGLIHISELSDLKIEHPSEVVSVGSHVMTQILRIDSTEHRLGLSIKQANPSPEASTGSDV